MLALGRLPRTMPVTPDIVLSPTTHSLPDGHRTSPDRPSDKERNILKELEGEVRSYTRP